MLVVLFVPSQRQYPSLSPLAARSSAKPREVSRTTSCSHNRALHFRLRHREAQLRVSIFLRRPGRGHYGRARFVAPPVAPPVSRMSWRSRKYPSIAAVSLALVVTVAPLWRSAAQFASASSRSYRQEPFRARPSVMPGLVPGIHGLRRGGVSGGGYAYRHHSYETLPCARGRTWMPGTSPGMTCGGGRDRDRRFSKETPAVDPGSFPDRVRGRLLRSVRGDSVGFVRRRVRPPPSNPGYSEAALLRGGRSWPLQPPPRTVPAAATCRPVDRSGGLDRRGTPLPDRLAFRGDGERKPPTSSTWRGPRPPGWTATRTGC